MAQWYESNRKLFCNERSALASAYPLLRLAVVGPGFPISTRYKLKRECAVVHGTHSLHVPKTYRQYEYGIALVLPENYPKQPPELFCNDPKLPIGNIDRHIMSDGRACLGIKAEIGMRWQHNPTIVDFINDHVAPFLTWQVYFDAFQKPPPWGERTHGNQGILEFYTELIGIRVDSQVIDFMRLLARGNQPKGHEPCPCKSGKRLRNCHRETVYNARQRVAWQYVKDDLEFLLRDNNTSPKGHKNKTYTLLQNKGMVS